MAYESERHAPQFVISVAAELSGMHAQTLRQYDRLGLVTPQRTSGGGRRYSHEDIERLRQVQRLSAEGVSLQGIHQLLQRENQVEALQARVRELESEVARLREVLAAATGARVFAAGASGVTFEIQPGRRPRRGEGESGERSLILWRPADQAR